MELELISTQLNANLGDYIEFLLKSLAGITVAGTLAMSIVQMLKASPVRGWFFKTHLQRFLSRRGACVETMERFIWKLSAGSEEAFYAQELEAITQELSAIKNLALAWPSDQENHEFLKIFHEQKANKLAALPPPADNKELSAYMQILVTAYIDGFQVFVKRRWTLYLQCTAIVISTALIFAFAPIDDVRFMILYGVLGGLIAPFARDLVKVLTPVK